MTRARKRTEIVPFPAAPERVVTLDGPLGRPGEQIEWTRGADGKYRTAGHRASTIDQLAQRHDQVRVDR